MTVKLSNTTLQYEQTTDIHGLGGIDMNGGVFPNMGDSVVLTDSASINAVETRIANAPYFGDMPPILIGASALPEQSPSALDAPQKIFLGPPQVTPEITLSLDDPGDPEACILTFQPGVYYAQTKLTSGRSGSSGNANVAVQVFVGNSPVPNGFYINRLDSSSALVDFPLPGIIIRFNVPTPVYFELARLSSPGPANNDGGLFAVDPTVAVPSWSPTPSAIIVLSRFS